MLANPPQRSMGCLGLLFMRNNFQGVRRRWHANAISNLAEGLMNLSNFVAKSGRRGDRSQVRILSPRDRSLSAKKMKFFRQLVAGLTIVCAATAAAQSSPSPASATPSASTPAAVEPPSLIPPNILPGPGAAALPQLPSGPDLQTLNALFKQSSLGKAADEHRLHLQMAELETRIRNDEDLHALKAAANKARTDLERRHGLKVYYQLYFQKLRALASTPDLRDYLRAQETARQASLLQPRVRHETDEAEAEALAKVAGEARSATALPTPVQARASDALRNP